MLVHLLGFLINIYRIYTWPYFLTPPPHHHPPNTDSKVGNYPNNQCKKHVVNSVCVDEVTSSLRENRTVLKTGWYIKVLPWNCPKDGLSSCSQGKGQCWGPGGTERFFLDTMPSEKIEFILVRLPWNCPHQGCSFFFLARQETHLRFREVLCIQ